MDLPKRKPTRLPNFDYNTPGAYFVTICVKSKRCILGNIVGGGALDAPQIHLTKIGKIVERNLLSGNRISNVCVDKYVIMPNHMHIILKVTESNGASKAPPPTTVTESNGASKAPPPTNAVIPHFVSTFKRFCHNDIGEQIFQRSYHDHIIRGDADYLKIWEYIHNNPAKWKEDCFYEEDCL